KQGRRGERQFPERDKWILYLFEDEKLNAAQIARRLLKEVTGQYPWDPYEPMDDHQREAAGWPAVKFEDMTVSEIRKLESSIYRHVCRVLKANGIEAAAPRGRPRRKP